MPGPQSDLTRVLASIQSGDATAAAQLLPIVYDELRKLAAQRLARESGNQTLQATALVHEAYLRLLGPEGNRIHWQGRGHFFAAAAEAMRRILIDAARAKRAQKRGSVRRTLRLEHGGFAVNDVPDEVLDLDEAIEKLAAEAPAKAQLVRLRFFAGLTLNEAAAALGISPTTADRHWTYARAWLFNELRKTAHPGSD